MARGHSGAILLPNGSIFVGPVTLPDRRVNHLRELLRDLASPGLCLVLGAGASHGLIPITQKEIANIAARMLQQQSNFPALSENEKKLVNDHPEVLYLSQLLKNVQPGAWDRFLVDLMSPGQATLILNDIFTPRERVPQALVDIYEVLENVDGSLITYNYDRIAERQTRFPVIAPHGQVLSALIQAEYGDRIRRMAQEAHIAIPNDWHLPVPEHEGIRLRSSYQDMLCAWRRARTVLFVGYGFGGGDDKLSFQDFGENVSPTTRIHVLSPRPGNVDLCKQIGSVLRDRNRGFRVYGQPYRWGPFAKAVLDLLTQLHSAHVVSAIGREFEMIAIYDRISG
jgi:hypothetical protein